MMKAGAVNAYHCETCHGYTAVIHKDDGVTPMFLGCRASEGCGGQATSLGYPDQENVPEWVLQSIAWEWYRPEGRDYDELTEPMKRHVDQGGLALRPLPEGAS